MKKFHPFFIIGTFGTIITALLHIFMALVLSVVTSHGVFIALYPTFNAFLMIGMLLTLKNQKEA